LQKQKDRRNLQNDNTENDPISGTQAYEQFNKKKEQQIERKRIEDELRIIEEKKRELQNKLSSAKTKIKKPKIDHQNKNEIVNNYRLKNSFSENNLNTNNKVQETENNIIGKSEIKILNSNVQDQYGSLSTQNNLVTRGHSNSELKLKNVRSNRFKDSTTKISSNTNVIPNGSDFIDKKKLIEERARISSKGFNKTEHSARTMELNNQQSNGKNHFKESFHNSDFANSNDKKFFHNNASPLKTLDSGFTIERKLESQLTHIDMSDKESGVQSRTDTRNYSKVNFKSNPNTNRDIKSNTQTSFNKMRVTFKKNLVDEENKNHNLNRSQSTNKIDNDIKHNTIVEKTQRIVPKKPIDRPTKCFTL